MLHDQVWLLVTLAVQLRDFIEASSAVAVTFVAAAAALRPENVTVDDHIVVPCPGASGVAVESAREGSAVAGEDGSVPQAAANRAAAARDKDGRIISMLLLPRGA